MYPPAAAPPHELGHRRNIISWSNNSLHPPVPWRHRRQSDDLALLINANSTVTIDASKAKFIDHDILETIEDFLATAQDDNISVEVIDLYGKEKMKTQESVVVLNKRAET
jgi:hypothetical protein